MRQSLYGHPPDVYRVSYRVIEQDQRVDILPIRQGTRQPMEASNIGEHGETE